MLPIYRSQSVLTLEKLEFLPRVELSRTWNGATSKSRIICALAFDRSDLFFCASGFEAALELAKGTPGEFKAGLWESDVAEVFISDGAESYQEINLSPSAAWWSASFSSARKANSDNFGAVKAQSVSRSSANGWYSAIKIPRSAIKVNLDNERGLRANLCACLGKQPRQYLSYLALPGEAADFHQPLQFSEVTIFNIC